MRFRQMLRADGIDLSTHNGESFQRRAKQIAGHRKLLCYRTSHCITHTASIPQGRERSRLHKLIWLTLSSLQDNPA